MSLVAGLLMCLYSAAKITHKTQAMTSVAAAWHADATVHAFDNDQENPDPDLPPTAGYLAPANAYRVAAGDESGSGGDDDDDSRSECSSLDDPKYVPFQAHNISFQKRQALGKLPSYHSQTVFCMLLLLLVALLTAPPAAGRCELKCSDVPGEQPGGDHGVRLRGGPGVAARALHDRVLARHVAARQDRRHLLNPIFLPAPAVRCRVFTGGMYKLSADRRYSDA